MTDIATIDDPTRQSFWRRQFLSLNLVESGAVVVILGGFTWLRPGPNAYVQPSWTTGIVSLALLAFLVAFIGQSVHRRRLERQGRRADETIDKALAALRDE